MTFIADKLLIVIGKCRSESLDQINRLTQDD